jgi:hypothetical protein
MFFLYRKCIVISNQQRLLTAASLKDLERRVGTRVPGLFCTLRKVYQAFLTAASDIIQKMGKGGALFGS